MKQAVICFTRVPRPGLTKTRLLGLLTPEQCARLHWAFLRDLAKIYPTVDADLFVAYTPDPEWVNLAAVFPYAAGYFPQEGADLGEKMYNAIAKVLALGYDRVVLTGTDLPQMRSAHLERGFEALAEADIAIGATPDGGYYLIGMKQPHEAPFHVANYGGATVYENTLAAIRAAGLTVAPALPCADVDTPEDLKNLRPAQDTATARCLAEFKEEGTAL